MKSTDYAWVKVFPGSFTVCDPQGIIIDMNDKAAEGLQADGGRLLIGKNVYECHPEPARSEFKHLMETRQSNVYTIEKHGVKKLIYQTPWYQAGKFAGFIELSLEVPFDMPHFVRD